MKYEVKGLENLSKEEGEKTKALIDKQIEDFIKKMHEPSEFNVMISTYSETGKRKEVSVRLDLKLNSRKFEVDSKEWDSFKAVRKAFDSLKNQVEQKFHWSETHHAYRKNPSSKNKPKSFKDLREDAFKQ